jgi:lipase ATG15
MKIFNNTFYKLIYDLAIMSNNVYTYINHSNWIDLPNYTVTDITNDNNTVKSFLFYNNQTGNNIISFKGTTTIIGLQEEEYYDKFGWQDLSSSYSDRFNDNLYFSCCFYKQSNIFNKSLCDYDSFNNICSKKCYKKSTFFNLNYINLANDIVENIKKDINFDNIIFTGHSLGGTIATIMGILYNKTSIAFQSPGDKHYLDLIGLHSHQNTYHFGHNADPIFMGTCGNTCWTFGYNIYTKCHSGYTCTYNAKEKLGYTESILNHRIDSIIKNIIPHWENDFPECIQDITCSDCESWDYN